MTRTDLEDAIRGLVQPRLALTTIWARGTTPTGATVARPATPYALLNLVSDVPEGLPDGYGDAELDADSGDYLETLTEDAYARVSIRVFGPGAWDKLQDLRLYLQTESSRTLADAAGIGVSSISGTTDMSGLDGAGWEQVCTMDLVVYRREPLAVDEGYMDSTTIGLTYKDGTTTVATDTVEAENV